MRFLLLFSASIIYLSQSTLFGQTTIITRIGDPMVGFGAEYSIPSKGWMFNSVFSTGGAQLGYQPNYFLAYFNLGFGVEDGFYGGNANNAVTGSDFSSEMTGDSYISHSFNDLDFGFTGKFSIIPAFRFAYGEDSESEEGKVYSKGYVSIGVGVDVTNHCATYGRYTVESEDADYVYTQVISTELHPRYWDVSPVFLLDFTRVGFTYSPKSVFDKSEVNHTIGMYIRFL